MDFAVGTRAKFTSTRKGHASINNFIIAHPSVIVVGKFTLQNPEGSKWRFPDQCHGFRDVFRCEPDGNSWCCGGGASGPEHHDRCTTNLTVSFDLFPFSGIITGGKMLAIDPPTSAQGLECSKAAPPLQLPVAAPTTSEQPAVGHDCLRIVSHRLFYLGVICDRPNCLRTP